MPDVEVVLKRLFEEELEVTWESVLDMDRFKDSMGLDNVDLALMLCRLEIDLDIELEDDFFLEIETIGQLKQKLLILTTTVH